MHPEINKSRHHQGLCMRILASEKPNAHALLAYFTWKVMAKFFNLR